MDQTRFIKSYRYLRLGTVALVLLLLTAVVVEWVASDGGHLPSLSAYYYTAVNAIFVGSLVSIGFAMIVIKGTPWEDAFLNLAGLLAPIVAFVPTVRPTECLRCAIEAPDVRDRALNNLTAYLVVGGLALLATYLLARHEGESVVAARQPIGFGFLVTLAVWAGGWAWLKFAPDSLLSRAHDTSAMVMFGFFGAVVVVNARRPRTEHLWLRTAYWAIVAAMVATAVILIPQILGTAFSPLVFWLEVIEIALFAAFWAGNTWENWYDGLAH